jgi:hypothetical protein
LPAAQDPAPEGTADAPAAVVDAGSAEPETAAAVPAPEQPAKEGDAEDVEVARSNAARRAAEAWMRAHGVEVDEPTYCGKAVESCDCYDVVRIAPEKEALLCRRWKVIDGFTLLTEIAVMVPRGKALSAVWKRPTASGPLDPVSPEDDSRISLEVSVEDEGRRISLRESRDADCEEALERARQFRRQLVEDRDAEGTDAASQAWLLRSLDRMRRSIDQVCAARGSYVWKSGTYRRE